MSDSDVFWWRLVMSDEKSYFFLSLYFLFPILPFLILLLFFIFFYSPYFFFYSSKKRGDFKRVGMVEGMQWRGWGKRGGVAEKNSTVEWRNDREEGNIENKHSSNAEYDLIDFGKSDLYIFGCLFGMRNISEAIRGRNAKCILCFWYFEISDSSLVKSYFYL